MLNSIKSVAQLILEQNKFQSNINSQKLSFLSNENTSQLITKSLLLTHISMNGSIKVSKPLQFLSGFTIVLSTSTYGRNNPYLISGLSLISSVLYTKHAIKQGKLINLIKGNALASLGLVSYYGVKKLVTK